jgi:hypothetical protein
MTVDVCCVNWGTKYSPEYTRRLYRMVRNNTTRDFKFYVLTDNTTLYDKDKEINAVEIDTDDTSWWTKMLLFREGTLPTGEYLYLDLDVIIVNNIDDVFSHPSFGITRDFIRPDNGLLPGPEYNSSVLRFNTATTQGLYDYYQTNKRAWLDCQRTIAPFFGDQNVISAYVNHYPTFLNVFPDEYCWSYKKGRERGKTAGDRSRMFGDTIPKGGKICVFHGSPNPDEVTGIDWIDRFYKNI